MKSDIQLKQSPSINIFDGKCIMSFTSPVHVFIYSLQDLLITLNQMLLKNA